MSESLKKSVIRAFSTVPGMKGMDQNQLILTTSIGLICGKPSQHSTQDENTAITQTEEFYSTILKIVNEEFGSGDVEGNDGYLSLTDVVIKRQGGADIIAGNMVVFYDQIIGVSYGSLS